VRRLFRCTLPWSLPVLLCLSILGQYSSNFVLGGKRLFSPSAPTLREDTPLNKAVTSLPYLASVGGVAFDGVARPRAGLDVRSLSLRYDSSEADGGRLILRINGKQAAVPLHDWQLIPIARFADSRFSACFTLFGSLTDPKRQAEVAKSKQTTRAMNYHPALANTLVGLRIFQLDELILSGDSTNLPTLNGRYILGAGESTPNPNAGLRALTQVQQGLSRIMRQMHTRFQSYLICDYKQTVEFSIENNRLRLTGAPYYFFWKQSRSRDVVPLSSLSDWMGKQTNLLRLVNPAVWDSGVNVMQYAAFFRYSKNKNPEAWNALMAQIRLVKAEPQVRTPTLMIEPKRH
jgi:hypothetical protein